MRIGLYIFIVCVCLFIVSACRTEAGGPVQTVLTDFGLRPKPEGYTTISDRVYQELDKIGEAELKRLNQAGRLGTVAFQQDGVRGVFYKQVKVYESFHPVDVRPTSTRTNDPVSFLGYIQYHYRMYRSPGFATRAEAQAATADLPTDEEGIETYRYSFNSGGTWTGAAGERVKNEM